MFSWFGIGTFNGDWAEHKLIEWWTFPFFFNLKQFLFQYLCFVFSQPIIGFLQAFLISTIRFQNFLYFNPRHFGYWNFFFLSTWLWVRTHEIIWWFGLNFFDLSFVLWVQLLWSPWSVTTLLHWSTFYPKCFLLSFVLLFFMLDRYCQKLIIDCWILRDNFLRLSDCFLRPITFDYFHQVALLTFYPLMYCCFRPKNIFLSWQKDFNLVWFSIPLLEKILNFAWRKLA